MKRSHLRGFVAAALLLTALALLGCSNDGDPAAPPDIDTTVPTPTVSLESPLLPYFPVEGLWCFGNDRFAACGDRGFVSTYDRGAWRSLNTGADVHLYAVWGQSLDDFYVVGDEGCILHWDGTAFTEINIGTYETLYAVWGADAGDIWIGGHDIAVHLVGGNVKTYTPGNGLPLSVTIYGVHGTSPKDVYAVGNAGRVLFWDGTAWAQVTTGLGNKKLNSVYADGNSVFIAADDGELWQYDGTAWSSFVVGTFDDFETIVGNGRGAVSAFGQGGLMYRWFGGTWNDMSGTFPFTPRSILSASVDGSGIYLGPQASTATILHFDNGTWTELPIPRATGQDLYDVWTFNKSSAFAVGGSGTVIERTASGWGVVNHGLTTERLWGVWASDRNNLYAVGDDGTVLHYDGATWILENTGLGIADLYDVAGNGPNNIWIVGFEAVWHWNGVAWSDRTSELPDPDESFECVYVAPDNTVYMANYTLVRYDGSSWTSIGFKNNNLTAYELWGVSSNPIWIAGDYVFARWNGTDITTHLAEEYHLTVTGSSDNSVLVSGENHIIHLANGLPTLLNSLHANDLAGASMGEDGTAYFVGSHGEIVRVE